jgi:hypothetical protein
LSKINRKEAMDFDASRSGTAPAPANRRNAGMSNPTPGVKENATKYRPTTRATGGGDIADINTALRLDRIDNLPSGYSEAVDSYREAIFSWGEPLEQFDAPKQAPTKRQPKSAYAQKSRVSQYRGGSGLSPRRGSDEIDEIDIPASFGSKVANVRAIYGVSSKPKAQTTQIKREAGTAAVPTRSSRPTSPQQPQPPQTAGAAFIISQKQPQAPASPVNAFRSTRGNRDRESASSPLTSTAAVMGSSSAGVLGSGAFASSGISSNALHTSDNDKVIRIDTTRPESAQHTRGSRPESRKLYLGSTTPGGPNGPSTGPGALRKGRAGSKGDFVGDPLALSADTRSQSPRDADSGKALLRNASFNGFARPAIWEPGELNLDQRPPSRQGSAFPVHLAGPDAVTADKAAATHSAAPTPVMFDTSPSPSLLSQRAEANVGVQQTAIRKTSSSSPQG